MERATTQSRALGGIDVHKKMLAVVVRRDQNGMTSYEQRALGTTKSEIGHLVAYLENQHVTEVVMESTAQYWRPVWYGMESHFRLHLSHPLQTRAPRGRKRDFRDARRLVDRLSSGDLEESFIPAAEQRGWRWLTRTRVDLQRKVVKVRNQVEGLGHRRRGNTGLILDKTDHASAPVVEKAASNWRRSLTICSG
jgi:hypothetical protein